MKVVCNNNYYIQSSDLLFLNSLGAYMPFYLAQKVKSSYTYDENNFIKINDPESIAYLEELDWLINYDDIKDMPFEDLLSAADVIINERNAIEEEKEYFQSNKEQLDNRIKILNYKLNHIKDILLYKDNKIKLNIPKENIFRRILIPKQKVS